MSKKINAPLTEEDQHVQCFLNAMEPAGRKLCVLYEDFTGDNCQFVGVAIFRRMTVKEMNELDALDILKLVACDADELSWLLYQPYETCYAVYRSMVRFSVKRLRSLDRATPLENNDKS